MEKIAIIIGDSNGSYPVPAVRGSAISILVEHLIDENEKANDDFVIEVFSFYDKDAERMSQKYNKVLFKWVKVPLIIKVLDKITYFLFKHCFKNKKAISFKTMFSLLYYIFLVSHKIKKDNYRKIVLENNMILAWIIKLSKYKGEYYYHLHNVPRTNAKCKSVFEKCNGFLCVSNYVKEKIMSDINSIGPIQKEKIKILYNCVDLKLFYKLDDKEKIIQLRNKFGISKEEKIIIFVGRISQEKGLLEVVKSMKFLQSKNIKLVIAGSFWHDAKEKDEYQRNVEMI